MVLISKYGFCDFKNIDGSHFTNAIRDLTDGDYIAGSVRMMDTALVVLGIALGVGMMFTAYYRITGGNLL